MEKCEEEKSLKISSIYKKACTNYAVTLEKLNKREEAVNQLEKLLDRFQSEVRIHNNLGII
jgi:hypothetical protein